MRRAARRVRSGRSNKIGTELGVKELRASSIHGGGDRLARAASRRKPGEEGTKELRFFCGLRPRSGGCSMSRPAACCGATLRNGCPLTVWAVRPAQRVGIRRVRVALARKLAVVLHAMWSDGQVFQWRRSEVSPST